MTPLPGHFSRIFDLVVVGTGWAGWAAALAARRRGSSVLLVGSRGDLVWESGRGFCLRTGTTRDPLWQELVAEVSQRTGRDDDHRSPLDGAVAEIVATEQLVAAGVETLYWAAPVNVTTTADGTGLLAALDVATKSGLRRIRGRQWIDATEAGSLVRLLDPEAAPRNATTAEIQLFLQHADWSRVTADGLASTGWPTERALAVAVTPDDPAWRLTVPAALSTLADQLGPAVAEVSMSHLSFEPVSIWQPGDGRPGRSGARCTVPANVAVAAPAFTSGVVETLADRHGLGVAASDVLVGLPAADPAAVDSAPGNLAPPATTVTTQVCVVGVGTGGSLAALAAARTDAEVVAVDPAGFVGGVGTGGGIHTYSFGVPGGLQSEVDRETRALMNRFGKGPFGDGPFNPWAKMITLERMLREERVTLRLGGIPYRVEVVGGRVMTIDIAGDDGAVRIAAGAFVDGTGDGDLAAMAGARYTLGREQDGLTHAYSQSSGVLRDLRGRPRMGVVNFDAGFCDPTDPVDLTRARITGIRQYLLPRYENLGRPTYLAPVLGLRQGRQIITEYVMSLDDQVMWRRFHDVIGHTASHYENHASDCEFESDEALFWVWANRQWTTPIGCELSYRMIVPRDIDNLWLASRCAGVSQDAHHATRMQRDVQRFGEAAGFAAGLAAQDRRAHVDPGVLRSWLQRTGALDRQVPRVQVETGFGRIGGGRGQLAELPENEARRRALELLDAGEPGEGPWWLARREHLVRDDVRARLTPEDAAGPMVSWLAAGVIAQWHDSAAEARLLQAVRDREYGYDAPWAWSPDGYNAPRADEPADPLAWKYVVPNWLCALGLLRLCGTEACLEPIEDLLTTQVHGLNTVTTIALTLTRLVDSRRLDRTALPRVAALADRLEQVDVVGTVDNPRRWSGRHSERALRGWDEAAFPGSPGTPQFNAREDNAWQVAYTIGRLRSSLGQSVPPSSRIHLLDERALVRRAFVSLLNADNENSMLTTKAMSLMSSD